MGFSLTQPRPPSPCLTHTKQTQHKHTHPPGVCFCLQPAHGSKDAAKSLHPLSNLEPFSTRPRGNGKLSPSYFYSSLQEKQHRSAATQQKILSKYGTGAATERWQMQQPLPENWLLFPLPTHTHHHHHPHPPTHTHTQQYQDAQELVSH